MLKLYDSRMSGNAYKVRLLLNNLGIPFERHTLALPEGKHKTPEFLAKNPLGRIPVLELEDGRTLFESNAILTYLAEGTELLPADRYDRARVMSWLFFEQFDLVRNIALPRFWITLMKQPEKIADNLPDMREAGNKALAVMDRHLETAPFFAAGRYTIADISLFGYTHAAHEAEYDMNRYPNVLRWVERVKAQPGYVPLLQD